MAAARTLLRGSLLLLVLLYVLLEIAASKGEDPQDMNEMEEGSSQKEDDEDEARRDRESRGGTEEEDEDEDEEQDEEDQESDDGENDDPDSGDDEAEGEDEEGEETSDGTSYISQQVLKKLHDKMDLNHDGKVTFHELMEYAEHVKVPLARQDVKAIVDDLEELKDDHRLSLAEVLKMLADEEDKLGDEAVAKIAGRKNATDLEVEKFRVADANHDGYLDMDEVYAFFYPESHSGILDLQIPYLFEEKDLDHDGKLSIDEWRNNPNTDGLALSHGGDASEEEKQEFKELDKDSDGHLNLSEFRDWESGSFYTARAAKALVQVTDSDKDGGFSWHEMDAAHGSGHLSGHEAESLLIRWGAHEGGEL